MFKIKSPCFALMRFFFWVARPGPKPPQNVVLVFFPPAQRSIWHHHHHMAQHRKGATRASPREAAKLCPKGKTWKKDIPRGFFSEKKKHWFSKTRWRHRRWGGCTHFWMFMFFFSHQKVLTMIHLGLALHSEGRPVFKKGRLNTWTRNVCAKWWKMIRKNKTEPLNMKLSIWQASIFQYSYPPWN